MVLPTILLFITLRMKFSSSGKELIKSIIWSKLLCIRSSISINLFTYLSFSILVIILVFSLREPAQSYFDPWDFFDSTFVYDFLRAKHVEYFAFGTQIPEVLNGLEIDSLGISDFAFSNLVYEMFNPFFAIAIIEFLVRVLAFIGFYLLTGSQKFFKQPSDIARAISSLAFALTPWHPHLGSTIALQPLILWILISNLDKRFIIKLVAIFVLTQNTSFVFGGFFDVILFIFFGLIALRKGRLTLRSVLLTLILIFGFIVANIRLLHLLLFTNFESHRMSWPREERLLEIANFDVFVPRFFDALIRGIPHMGNPQSLRLFLPLDGHEYWYFGLGIVGYLFICVWTVHFILGIKSFLRFRVFFDLNFPRGFLGLSLVLVMIVAFYIAEESDLTNFNYLSPIPWQFSRVAIVVPTIICCLFAICVDDLVTRLNLKRLGLAITTLFLLLSVQAAYNYYPLNGKIREIIQFSEVQSISEYFQQSTYQQLKVHLSEGDSTPIRVLNYDLDPAVASFNGFFSLDGYSNNYSRGYKEEFREIIRLQLERDPVARVYFDDWGSRAYLIFEGRNPTINWCAASLLGAQYVLSRQELDVDGVSFSVQVGQINAYRIDDCD